MSAPEYPPPSYDGSAGETSAWVRGASALPELPMGAGSAAHYLATGQTTGGEDDRASFSLRHDTFWVDRE